MPLAFGGVFATLNAQLVKLQCPEVDFVCRGEGEQLLLDLIEFDAEAYQAAYGGPDGVPGGIDPTPFATGPMLPPEPTERGFKGHR